MVALLTNQTILPSFLSLQERTEDILEVIIITNDEYYRIDYALKVACATSSMPPARVR